MTAPRTVFATNLAGDHIYDSAKRFGTLRPVTSGAYPVFKSNRIVEELCDVLVESSEDDYLLFSGSGFLAALCLVIWLRLHPSCKALLYDRREASYVPRLVRREDVLLQIERAADRRTERRRA